MVPKVSNTLRALHEIRDEVKALERRQTEMEVRVVTALGSVNGTLIEMRDLLRDRLVDRSRVDDHERRIGALERAVGARRP